MDYMCQQCKFTFASAKIKERCPYCGEKSYLSEVKRAEDLINESNKG